MLSIEPQRCASDPKTTNLLAFAVGVHLLWLYGLVEAAYRQLIASETHNRHIWLCKSKKTKWITIDGLGADERRKSMNQPAVLRSTILDDNVKNAISPTYPGKPMHRGMPPFDPSGPPLSFYEFWPPKLFYAPISLAWIILAIRHGSATLPTVANPLFPVGGLVGDSKKAILSKVGGASGGLVARFTALTRGANGSDGVADREYAESLMAAKQLSFPVVVKPDIGCRGVGVQIVRDRDALLTYLKAFPLGGRVVIQKLVPYEGEAGVFYIRFPGEKKGFIFSLTLKYFPFVIGDGKTTLRKLIERDPRAGAIKHVYLKRHEKRLDEIVPNGQNFRLAFTGSHSRGTIFRNGNKYITDEMGAAFDRIANDINEFYFGRFDVRFSDFQALRRGHGFTIIEINGAGGEATHIWDRNTPILEAYRTLFKQVTYLFSIGARNRRRGFTPATGLELWRAYRREKQLTRNYPHTE